MLEYTHPLKLVIYSAPHVLVRIPHDCHHVLRCLTLVQRQHEAVSEPADRRLPLEGWEAGAQHQLHRTDKLVRVWTDGQKCFHCQLLEQLVALGGTSTHENDHLMCELEPVGFKCDALNKVVSGVQER